MDQPTATPSLVAPFLTDRELAYPASRRAFAAGERLDFDDPYRLCHLPLVAPGHARAIRNVPGKDYVDGRYAASRRALVVPVDWPALAAQPAFQALERQMAAASFAGKIAWDLGRQRRGHLHATLASGLTAADVDRAAAALARLLPDLGTLRFRLGGPLVGNRNWGRIYLPAYPGRVAGGDPFARMQAAVGAAASGFYGVGYYHLADPLDPAETADLARILAEWEGATVAELPLDHLELHATNDDLALSGRPLATVAAVSGRVTRHPE